MILINNIQLVWTLIAFSLKVVAAILDFIILFRVCVIWSSKSPFQQYQ